MLLCSFLITNNKKVVEIAERHGKRFGSHVYSPTPIFTKCHKHARRKRITWWSTASVISEFCSMEEIQKLNFTPKLTGRWFSNVFFSFFLRPFSITFELLCWNKIHIHIYTYTHASYVYRNTDTEFFQLFFLFRPTKSFGFRVSSQMRESNFFNFQLPQLLEFAPSFLLLLF